MLKHQNNKMRIRRRKLKKMMKKKKKIQKTRLC